MKELKNKVGKSSRQQVTAQQLLEEQLEDTKKKIMSLQHNNKLLKQENSKKVEVLLSVCVFIYLFVGLLVYLSVCLFMSLCDDIMNLLHFELFIYTLL